VRTLTHASPINRRRLIGLGFGFALSACAIDREPKTTALRFKVDADDQINPNSANAPSPTVLRIYELKQLNAFSGATLFELLDNDTTVLGQDLVAKREIEIKPGERLSYDRATPIETHMIGVIAGFRTLESATWRASVEIRPEHSGLVTIKLTAQTVMITLLEDKFLGFF
jgi:type VI secretion system protein VasD